MVKKTLMKHIQLQVRRQAILLIHQKQVKQPTSRILGGFGKTGRFCFEWESSDETTGNGMETTETAALNEDGKSAEAASKEDAESAEAASATDDANQQKLTQRKIMPNSGNGEQAATDTAEARIGY